MQKLLTCLFGLTFILMQGQEVTAVNKATSLPVAGVAAFNSTKTQSTISNIDGKIVLDSFNANDIITFQHILYVLKRVKKSEIGYTIFLVPKSQDLNEVVISVSKFQQNKREVPQKILSFGAE